MRHSIDFKSVVIGVLFAALAICVIGAVPHVLLEEYGRFQIETNDSHAFILDSATGQVWSSIFISPATGVGVRYDPNFHAIKTYHEADSSQ